MLDESFHSDHFGEGSKLKRAPKETNERSNNPLDLVSSSDDDGAVIIRADIYCAGIECEGIADFSEKDLQKNVAEENFASHMVRFAPDMYSSSKIQANCIG